MEVSKIRELCIDSSEKYYDYLAKNDKGVHIIEVRKVESVRGEKFKLKIGGKIFDQDAIVFKYLGNGKQWGPDLIKIEVYDRDSNILIVKPDKDIVQYFSDLKAANWQMISDLKFLVKRVEDWYSANGSDLALPSKASSLSPPSDSIFLKGKKPSTEQRKALDLIFNEPFSYIWGAPGTGKTQFVLSYAILHYLKHGKKVAIMAPTNYALEQIFRGVIQMTDLAGISRDKILRLGGPSKKFADDFPEICEVRGVEEKLRELEMQIEIIQKVLGIDPSSKDLKLLQSANRLWAKWINKQKELEGVQKEFNELQISLSKTATHLREKQLKLDYVRVKKRSLLTKQGSVLHSLKKLFLNETPTEREVDELIKQQVKLEQFIEEESTPLKELKKKENQLKFKLEETQNAVADIKQKVEGKIKKVKSVDIAVKELNSLSDYQKLIKGSIVKIENQKSNNEALKSEYQKLNKGDVEKRLQGYIDQKEKLEAYDTQERLRNVKIIGATLDTYLYRFKEEDLGVDHIFLDEAGYCNVIKAQTLLNQAVPITLLGDHMQLPPVCELSRLDIQKDKEHLPILLWDHCAIYLEDLYEQGSLEGISKKYFSQTNPLFERLKKSNLTSTFRFGTSLCAVLQQFVYPEGFRSELIEDTEIIIYDVQNNVKSWGRQNQAEVEAIQQLAQGSFETTSDVAILTPYNQQVRALMKVLPGFHDENKIMTVHKSQGQEWDTVIYSVCDPGNGKRPWFTDSQNGMSNGLNNINTAISRTKRRLIIVCSYDAWIHREGQLIQGLLQAATNRVRYNDSQVI